MTSQRRAMYVKIFGILITIVLVVTLFTQISIKDIITTLANINPVYLLAGFVLYTGSYFLRALRFHNLLNKEVSIKDLFHIECVHNMTNNLFPARTGEFSYVYLLRKINNRTTGEGLATLVVARIFDFIALIILFFIAVLLVNAIPGIIRNALWLIAFFAIALLVILFGLLYTGRTFISCMKKITEKVHIDQYRLTNYLMKKGLETAGSLEKIQIKKQSGSLLIISLLIWTLNYLMVYLLVTGMNFQLPFFIIILGGTFILLTTVLPVQGIGGFGTTETIWTLVFVPLGMPLDAAIISAFCYHIISIVFYGIIGIYGYVKLKIPVIN